MFEDDQKNTIKNRVCMTILYKDTTNNEVNYLMEEYNFTLAIGKAQVSASRDFVTPKQGEGLRKPKSCFQTTIENITKCYSIRTFRKQCTQILLRRMRK